jgi:glutamate dehydrogenase (NAD(P)+)
MGSFKGYEEVVKGTTVKTKDYLSLFEKECDYLVPAATEKSIHMDNVEKIKCKAVFEGANGPTTYAGETILNEKGIVVCPDMLVNGGGVTCSYFEWLKNIQHVSPGQMTKRFDK